MSGHFSLSTHTLASRVGHKTPSIFRRYNLGDTEALRDRLTRATAWVRSLPIRRSVVPLRGGALPSVAS